MQAKNGSIILTIIVCTIILGIFVYWTQPEPIEPQEINVPTAAEIAELIEVPDVEIPSTRLALRENLKKEALELCDEEIDLDEIEDLFDDDDEVEIIKEYTDKRDFKKIDLGIDNVDDREITIERVFKVEVEPDLDDDYKDRVYIECEVTSDDGELEADLEYDL